LVDMLLTESKDPELSQSAGSNLAEEVTEPWHHEKKEIKEL